jgi:beta-lactamase superfamily II metal-dependent hydrolase
MRRAVLLLVVLLLTACRSDPTAQPPAGLVVHFIDVGQGAATLVEGPAFAILVDAGRPDGSEVVAYLRSRGIKRLDLLVGTHPHADHIGQVPEVLEAIAVKEVWLSGNNSDTRTFASAIRAVQRSQATYHEPRAGEMRSYGDARVEVLAPKTLTGDLNRDSIVLRVSHQGAAVLLPGDSGIDVEDALISSRTQLRADVLGVAHHGSASSTSAGFLAAIQPQVAVYSASRDNPYGYPHWELVDRVAAAGVRLYGTDVNGTIRVSFGAAGTGKDRLSVNLERQGAPRPPNRPVVSGQR